MPPAAGRPAPAAGAPSRHSRILWSGDRLLFGRFRADPREDDFAEAGPIGNWPEIAFPRSPVQIHQEGAAPFVADSTLMVLYNPRQGYRRVALSGEGDRCEWLAVEPALLPELGEGLPENDGLPFGRSHAPLPPAACLRMRRIAHRVASGGADPLWIEESLLRLLADCLAKAGGGAGCPGTAARREGWVREAKVLLAARLDRRLTLGEVARRLGLSPFHLCRLFSASTGSTLHAYRNDLRLRASLTRLLESSEDLTSIALELGFSSHSHFTSAFRRKFGLTPSGYRSSAGSEIRDRAVPPGS